MKFDYIQKIHLVKEYVERLCNVADIHETHLHQNCFIKASTEFVLFCYIQKRKKEVPSILLETCDKIEDKLTLDYFDPKKLSGIKGLFQLIGLDHLRDYSECIYELVKLKNNKNLHIEDAFFLETLSYDINNNYWNLAALEIIKVAIKNGLTDENFYQITHVIMFATQMGNRNIADVCSEQTIEIFKVFLDEVRIHAEERKFWDILLEVYLSELYIEKINSGSKKKMVDTLKSIPLVQDFLITYGEDIKNFSSNIENPYNKSTYELYHTTLLSCMLNFELEQF